MAGLIADVGYFRNNAVNEGCGQNTLSKRLSKEPAPKSGACGWGTKSAQLEGTVKSIAEAFTGHDVYRLAH